MIQQALLQLLAEKSFAELTVKELCDKALISRGTFYAHYEDKYFITAEQQAQCAKIIRCLASSSRQLADWQTFFASLQQQPLLPLLLKDKSCGDFKQQFKSSFVAALSPNTRNGDHYRLLLVEGSYSLVERLLLDLPKTNELAEILIALAKATTA